MEAGEPYPFKLGRHEPGLGVIEHRYEDVFEEEAHEGVSSLVIASWANQIELVLRISRSMAEPLRLVYVLLVPFGGYAEGRYEFTEPFSHQSLEVLLDRFREFFERDARHHLVVGDSMGNRRLTYDQHNFICVVGPTDDVRRVLEVEGFRPGSVELPIPHSHHHHAEFDSDGERLLEGNAWVLSPLLDTD